MFSQEEIPFKIRFQQYLKGDLTFIANNIINRNTNQNANEPYDKITSSAKLNDEFEMAYIDIDNDPTTFSSSSATLKAEGNPKEIVFAGLYWAANYRVEVGTTKQTDAFLDADRVQNFNEIKIKTPNSSSYQNIKGTLLFDGFQNPTYKSSSPYICFSDITSLVQQNPYGTYTVANIKATQGFIQGGSSGGWIVYFIYKDAKMPPKYISIYDGFAHVFKEPTEIKLFNFLTPKTGQINPKITLCSLEGDLSIEGDNVALKNSENNKYFQLSSVNRSSQNFFKSFITIENNHFMDRKPASLNTLGFDAMLQTLDNKKNQIIANNTTQTEIKISSTGDDVFLFALGFSIEVDETFYAEKKQGIPGNVNEFSASIPADTIKPSPKPAKTKKTKKLIQNITIKVKELPDLRETSTKEDTEDTALAKDSLTYPKAGLMIVFEESDNSAFSLKSDTGLPRELKTIPKITSGATVKPGFYIVPNVFTLPANCTNYMNFLKRNHILSSYFVNPENNYRYVYLGFYDTYQNMINAYHSNMNATFFDDYWILEVTK